ncbi:MAG: hypothetical protein ACI4DK_06115 [Lachnospiraceae bacterium]
MATRTKNTETENLNNEEVQEAVSTSVKKKTPRKFEQNDPILCKSVTYGELLYPAKKSQLLYSWANYGDVTEVEYQDLQALRSTKSAYLNAPYFVIEDEELLEQWPELKKLYEKIATVDIDKMFDLPINKFKIALRNLPVGFRDSIKNIASAKILDGTLDSLSKIKAVDEVFNTDLKLLIE